MKLKLDELKNYPDVLDLNQVRQILGLQTSQQVNSLLRKMIVPSHRIGNKVLVKKDDLIKMLGSES